MNTWIFQGNPDRFDVNEYLRKKKNIYWTVSSNKHQDLVAIGDLVFLWRARGKSKFIPGIVGRGYINMECTLKSEIRDKVALSEELWAEMRLEPNEVKAGVSLEEIRLSPEEGMIPLADIRLDPILSEMVIVKVKTGSNFLLTPEQAQRLDVMWQSVGLVTDEELYSSEEYLANEGRVKFALHRYRERDRKLIDIVKKFKKQTQGNLSCEVCGFSFELTYGEIGKNFIEAHHKKPISQLKEGEETRVEDIILVCSNCHRMLHIGNPEENLAMLIDLFGSRSRGTVNDKL